MAYRKLRGYPRTLDTMNRLESFIRAAIGKKYKLTASKIFTKKQINDEAESADKSYFCSELIACAYKCLELLP